MTHDEPFLARWSRRKRAAEEDAAAPAPPKGAEEVPETGPPVSSDRPGRPEAEGEETRKEPQLEIDLTKLPSLESITAATDIRPFLAPGVPDGLRSAALRRAWSADPAIREFVGLAENAWDFTAPETIAGFGSLSASEAARVAAKFAELYGSKDAGETPTEERQSAVTAEKLGLKAERDLEGVRPESTPFLPGNLPKTDPGAAESSARNPDEIEIAALSPASEPGEDEEPPRSHGTAMPR